MSTRPLLKDFLLILNILGLHPAHCNKWTLARLIIAVIFLIGLAIENLLQCFYYWDGLNSMDSVSIFMGAYQLLFRLSIAVVFRATLKTLVIKMEKFWPTNKYGLELQKEIEDIYGSVKKIANCTMGFLVVAVMVYFLKPFFASERVLPYHTYHPTDLNRSPAYELMFLSQFLVVSIASCLVMGFDGLFVSFVININCEFKMIKKGFNNLEITADRDEDEIIKDLGYLIDQHDLVLGCIKDLNTSYCVFLLNFFLSNMFCICIGLLCIIADGIPPSIDTLSKHGSYVVIHIGQLFFYCVTGSRLIIESESVANTVYNVPWWLKTQPRVRRALALVIQRANRAEYITAGGMFILDLENFSNIIRSALSFFTFMEAVYEDVN